MPDPLAAHPTPASARLFHLLPAKCLQREGGHSMSPYIIICWFVRLLLGPVWWIHRRAALLLKSLSPRRIVLLRISLHPQSQCSVVGMIWDGWNAPIEYEGVKFWWWRADKPTEGLSSRTDRSGQWSWAHGNSASCFLTTLWTLTSWSVVCPPWHLVCWDTQWEQNNSFIHLFFKLNYSWFTMLW